MLKRSEVVSRSYNSDTGLPLAQSAVCILGASTSVGNVQDLYLKEDIGGGMEYWDAVVDIEELYKKDIDNVEFWELEEGTVGM